MRKKLLVVGLGLLTSIGLTGCGTTLPLVFADKTTVGVEASGSEQGVEVIVGFKTKSVGVVPVAVRQKDENGNVTEIVKIEGKGTNGINDAYSTFGNFTMDTDVKTTTASIGLGRFFATGVAAQTIAEKIGEAMVKKADQGQ